MTESEKIKIYKIIIECMPDKNLKFTENSLLREEIGFCSFDMMVLIAVLEKEGFVIDSFRIGKIRTVGDLLDNIEYQ